MSFKRPESAGGRPRKVEGEGRRSSTSQSVTGEGTCWGAGKAEPGSKGARRFVGLWGPGRRPEPQVVSVCVLVNHL